MANVIRAFHISIVDEGPRPHARALRTGFKQKLKTAYDFMFGDPNTAFGITLGLYDYLTLGLGVLAHHFLVWCEENEDEDEDPSFKRSAARVLYYPAVLLLRLRQFVSGVLTLVALPIVAIVHGITSFIKWVRGYEEDIMALSDGKSTLGQNDAFKELFSEDEPNQKLKITYDGDTLVVVNSPVFREVLFRVIPDTSENYKKAFNAITALNLGKFAEHDEEYSSLVIQGLR